MPNNAIRLVHEDVSAYAKIAAQARAANKQKLHVTNDGRLVFGFKSWRVRFVNGLQRLFGRGNVALERNRAAMSHFAAMVSGEYAEDGSHALEAARHTMTPVTGKSVTEEMVAEIPLTSQFICETVKELNRLKLDKMNEEFNARVYRETNKLERAVKQDFPEIEQHTQNNAHKIKDAFNHAIKVASNDNAIPLSEKQMEAVERKVIHSMNPTTSSALEARDLEPLDELPKEQKDALEKYCATIPWDNSEVANHNKKIMNQYRPATQKFQDIAHEVMVQNTGLSGKIPQRNDLIADNHAQIAAAINFGMHKDAERFGRVLDGQPDLQKALVKQAIAQLFSPEGSHLLMSKDDLTLLHGTIPLANSVGVDAELKNRLQWNVEASVKKDMYFIEDDIPGGPDFEGQAEDFFERKIPLSETKRDTVINFFNDNKDGIKKAIDKTLDFKCRDVSMTPLTMAEAQQIRDFVKRYGYHVHRYGAQGARERINPLRPSLLSKSLRAKLHQEMRNIEWKGVSHA